MHCALVAGRVAGFVCFHPLSQITSLSSLIASTAHLLMASSEDGARWAAIGTALDSPVVKTQAAVWELERKQMMGIVSQFWNVESRNFKNFVENKANSDAVSAIVITSLEDTPAVRCKKTLGIISPLLRLDIH